MKEIKEGMVSIIMPSYNTGRFIGESIESVIKQTYENWELIIVDDCSKDNTDAVVANYKDNRIRYIKNSTNCGAAISRNLALCEARGEWIAFLDSDDLWFPEKLEKQIRFMTENKYYFSCCARNEIDENSKILGKTTYSPKHITRWGMYLYCWVGCLGVMYHYPTVGLIQIEDLKKNNDYAMWLKVIKKSDCYCMDDVLASYRVRAQSISHDRFWKLVLSHYVLFRKSEYKGILLSVILTSINMVFGLLKRIIYVKNDI